MAKQDDETRAKRKDYLAAATQFTQAKHPQQPGMRTSVGTRERKVGGKPLSLPEWITVWRRIKKNNS